MKIFIIFVSIILLNASNIDSTKTALNNTKLSIKQMNLKLNLLAKDIFKTQKDLKKINKRINSLNTQIAFLKNSLKNSTKTLKELNILKNSLMKKKAEIDKEILIFLTQNYYINSKEINTLNDLIYTTLTEKILKALSQKINNLIQEKKLTKIKIDKINKQIIKINNQKKILEKKRKELLKLKRVQLNTLKLLNKQKEIYKAKLENMLKRQHNLQKKLAELKIINKKEIIPYIPLKSLNVKKIGNAYIKPKTTSYRGVKTIPPVKGTIIKRFGSYIDPIYKIRIYNDSITIKTKPNALVRAILPGKVIYIGEEGDKKIIFIKHKNNLFSIYGNLSKISPLIKKGSFVKKGEIIARVKDSLEFEVTYKDKAINPLEVIKLNK
jgi:septal ring factor EnvC (AmiA/AmiB activator)